MSLIVEVLQKIRLLLDKPISPLTRGQIVELVNKQVASADQLLVLFARKYRADLLLYLIEAQPVTVDKMQYLLGVIIDKLLEFKIDQASSIWKMILSKQEMKSTRQQWTDRLFKQSLRNTNESLKTSQLQLLKQHGKFLWEWNQSRCFEQLTKNYCKAFIKFNIYLSPYPALLYFLFCKAETVKNDLIDNDLRTQLVIRLSQFLNLTKDKQLFGFQNECLKACCKILESGKTKMNDLLILHSCEKMLEDYLWKKPTRQQAYKCKQATKKTRALLDKQNKEKMTRNYESQIPQPQQPILIEQVINKTNLYRRNNHLLISESKISDKPQRSSYLKRGKGNGGGKSAILSPIKRSYESNEFDKLDELVESCFRKTNDSHFSQKQIEKKQDYVQQYEASLYASTISVEQDKQFCEISNLIDLAYQYKFGSQTFE